MLPQAPIAGRRESRGRMTRAELVVSTKVSLMPVPECGLCDILYSIVAQFRL